MCHFVNIGIVMLLLEVKEAVMECALADAQDPQILHPGTRGPLYSNILLIYGFSPKCFKGSLGHGKFDDEHGTSSHSSRDIHSCKTCICRRRRFNDQH